MEPISLFDQPTVRATDPPTSGEAFAAVLPSIPDLERVILWHASYSAPATAFTIAERVEFCDPGRWDEGTVRSRVSNLGKRGLLVKDGTGTSPRGHKADLWRLP